MSSPVSVRRQSALSTDTDPLSSSQASFRTAPSPSTESSQYNFGFDSPPTSPAMNHKTLQVDTTDSIVKNVIPPPLPSPPASDDGDGETYREREWERNKGKEPLALSRPSQSEPARRAPPARSSLDVTPTQVPTPAPTMSTTTSATAPGNRTSAETIRADIPKPSPADYLQPPPMSTHRPHRRNTTGSAARSGSVSSSNTVPPPASRSLHTQYASHPHYSTPVISDDVADMGMASQVDTDVSDDIQTSIQMHADKIRRERMEKRAQQQAQAEAQLTRQASSYVGPGGKKPKPGEDVPLVGNLIGEDHVNYVLMYNMLTGIRIGVSRCQAKPKRPLTDEDFTAKHKYSFDIIGNELTPSAKYDFKFKDYAPWVFRALREDHFHLDPADYLLSLTSKYILSELGSPGKSGSFFYFSRDYRFIIKTIHHREHKFLLKVLKRYYEHVKANPHTLLSRFYGLHRVKMPHGRKIHFVIMNNLFPPHRDVHETYDLKGSTVGREWVDRQKKEQEKEKAETQSIRSEKNREKEKEKKKVSSPVLKDLNWIKAHNYLELGPEKRALLTEQLRRDKEMLKEIRVMDYSLLVGIHNMKRGNRDQVRRKTLRVFEPELKGELAVAGSTRALGAGAMGMGRSVTTYGHGHGQQGGVGGAGSPGVAGTRAPGPLTKSMSMNLAHHRSGTSSQDVAALRRAMRESDPRPWSEKEFRSGHGRSLSAGTADGGAKGALPTVKIEAALTPPLREEVNMNETNTASGFTVEENEVDYFSQGQGQNRVFTTEPQPVVASPSPISSTSQDPSSLSSGDPTTTIASNPDTNDTTPPSAPETPSPLPELDLPITMSDDNRAHFLFYQDEGGLRATDEENNEMEMIYYLGVIDILTPYGGLKKVEHFWKGLSADRHKISPVPPAEYAERFFRFMKAIMRGGSGGEDFV